jgi:hypothetical protein
LWPFRTEINILFRKTGGVFRLRRYNSIPNMEKKDMKTWVRRLGFAGFMFFLIKGLLWIAVFMGLFKAGCQAT